MITPENRNIARTLFAQGLAKKEIARVLKVDPKTVRSILRGPGDSPRTRRDKKAVDPDLLRDVLRRTDGYIQRAYEILTEEHGLGIAYSTLTRLVRRSGIKNSEDNKRHPSVGDVPGEEMQHDTSTYRIQIAGKIVRVVLSGLYLRFSKLRYLKFYPFFNRFLMKCFFYEALLFWQYSAGRCVIDNTNLAVHYGTGKEAVFHDEMLCFARPYGFEWFAHEKGHSNRKAGKERNFWTVETNFLPGRTFKDFTDLNLQAFDWATRRYALRPQSKTRLVPAELFEREKPYLVKLPAILPEPFRDLQRSTDQNGYVPVNGNYYWIPGKSRPDTRIIEYAKRIRIHPEDAEPIEYDLPDWAVRGQKYSPEGAQTNPCGPRNLKQKRSAEEKQLRESPHPAAVPYLDFIRAKESAVRYPSNLIGALYNLYRRLPKDVFGALLERALEYRVATVESLDRIAQKAKGPGRNIPESEFTGSDYLQRPSYQKGRFLQENPVDYGSNSPGEDLQKDKEPS